MDSRDDERHVTITILSLTTITIGTAIGAICLWSAAIADNLPFLPHSEVWLAIGTPAIGLAIAELARRRPRRGELSNAGRIARRDLDKGEDDGG